MKQKQKIKTVDIKGFFKLMKEKNIRIEDIAHDTRYSYPALTAWRRGATKPSFVATHFLEQKYGVKIV